MRVVTKKGDAIPVKLKDKVFYFEPGCELFSIYDKRDEDIILLTERETKSFIKYAQTILREKV